MKRRRKGAKVLRIGSACSGWCSELFAAEKLQLAHVSCFACDTDRNCQAVSQQLWRHEKYFQDALGDEFMQDTPSDIDLFTAGPPCQPFSQQGERRTIDDPRAALLLQMVLWIARKRPTTFIIEQVKGLQSFAPKLLLYVLQTLANLEAPTAGKEKLYTVQYRLLDASVHSGLPQHRERLFIVGVKRARQKRALVWPAEAQQKNTPPVCFEAKPSILNLPLFSMPNPHLKNRRCLCARLQTSSSPEQAWRSSALTLRSLTQTQRARTCANLAQRSGLLGAIPTRTSTSST